MRAERFYHEILLNEYSIKQKKNQHLFSNSNYLRRQIVFNRMIIVPLSSSFDRPTLARIGIRVSLIKGDLGLLLLLVDFPLNTFYSRGRKKIDNLQSYDEVPSDKFFFFFKEAENENILIAGRMTTNARINRVGVAIRLIH